MRAITLRHWQPFHTLLLFYHFLYWSFKLYNIHVYLPIGVTTYIWMCLCLTVFAEDVILQISRLFNSSYENSAQIPSYIPINCNCLNNWLVYRTSSTSRSQSNVLSNAVMPLICRGLQELKWKKNSENCEDRGKEKRWMEVENVEDGDLSWI